MGDDRSLRLWDMETRSSVKAAVFETEVVSASYTHNGELIAVAYGGTGRKCGGFAIVQANDLEVIHEARDSQLPPSLIRYSADGSLLALGTGDGRVFLYNVSSNYELIARCTLPTGSTAMSLDFSADARFFRVTTSTNLLSIFSCEDGLEQTKYVTLRDILWATHTCTLAWGTQGAHTRSVTAVDLAGAGDEFDLNSPMLAVADEFGTIDLCRYPLLAENSSRHVYPAHARAVATVLFAARETRLLSCGRHDRTILQWRCLAQKLPSGLLPPPEEVKKTLVVAPWDSYADQPRFATGFGKLHGGVQRHRFDPSVEASLAWVNSVIPPSDPPPCPPQACNAYLKLEHVYNVQCKVAYNMLRYSAAGNLIFASDAVAVCMNPTTRVTNLQTAHGSMITALCVSVDGTLAASGDVGPNPRIVVWSPDSGNVRLQLSDCFDGAISQLVFSPDGRHLAVLTCDRECSQVLHILHWETRTLLSRRAAGDKQSYACAFNILGSHLAQVGEHHVKVWQVFPNPRYMTVQEPALPAHKVAANPGSFGLTASPLTRSRTPCR